MGLSLFVAAAPSAHAEAELQIVGAGPNGVQIDATKAELTETLKVVGMTGDPVSPDRLEVIALKSASGKEAVSQAKWSDGKAPIDLGTPRTFTLTVKLPEPGTFTGTIDLVYAKKRTLTPLTVTWKEAPAKSPPGLDVLSSSTVRVARTCPWDDATPSIIVLLRDNDGKSKVVQLSGPPAVALQAANDRKIQVPGVTVDFPKGDLTVSENKTETLTLKLSGMKDPGVYEGKMRLAVAEPTQSKEGEASRSAKDRQPLDLAFTVIVKDEWYDAAIAIAIGVLSSFGVRRYVGGSRQSLVWQRELEAVLRKLGDRLDAGDLGPDARAVILAVRGRVQQLREDLAVGRPVSGVDESLKLFASEIALLDDWLVLARRAGALPEGPDREALRGDLYEQAKPLRTPSNEDAIRSAMTKLEEIATRDEKRRGLRRAIEDLREALGVTVAQVGDVILQKLAPVEDALREAGKDLVTQSGIDGGITKLDQARQLCANVLTEALEATLASDPPAGVTADVWGALVETMRPLLVKVKTEGTPTGAVAAYEQAHRQYVADLANLLASTAETARAVLPAEAPLRGRLEQLAVRLRGDAVRARAGDVGDAMKACAEGQKALAEASAAVAKKSVRAKAGGGDGEIEAAAVKLAAASPAPPQALVPGAMPGAARAVTTWTRATREQLGRRIKFYDFWVTVALLFVAVALGLRALWVPSETWGGLDAYLIAILWGFGLYQVGSAPFEGLAGLRDKMSKTQN